jgi:hypothetical protein
MHSRSGLNLTETRAYSANLARFISRDPIEEVGGVNLYGYIENDPINDSDPSGMLCLACFGWPPGGQCDKKGKQPSRDGRGQAIGTTAPDEGPPPKRGPFVEPHISPGNTSIPPTGGGVLGRPHAEDKDCEKEIEKCN